MTGKKFSLKRATLAVDIIDGKRTAVHIPVAGVIEIVPGYTEGDVTVEVLWEGRTVLMFAVDVSARGTEINTLEPTDLSASA